MRPPPTRQDLAYYDRAYQEAQEPTDGPTKDWPEGDHEAEIAYAKLRFTQAGKPTISIGFKSIDGSQDGYQFKTLFISNDSQRLGWIKHDLRKMGLSIARLSELPDRLHELLGNECTIRVRATEKDGRRFVNTHILQGPPRADVTASGGGFDATAQDDDIPF